MMKSYLMENYGYNEPIFLNELSIEGLSENAVRQSVKRLVTNGFLDRYDNGIYYIPKQGGLLGKSYLDPSLVIMRKYVIQSVLFLRKWYELALIALNTEKTLDRYRKHLRNLREQRYIGVAESVFPF